MTMVKLKEANQNGPKVGKLHLWVAEFFLRQKYSLLTIYLLHKFVSLSSYKRA